jgi:hypothetical protein
MKLVMNSDTTRAIALPVIDMESSAIDYVQINPRGRVKINESKFAIDETFVQNNPSLTVQTLDD